MELEAKAPGYFVAVAVCEAVQGGHVAPQGSGESSRGLVVIWVRLPVAPALDVCPSSPNQVLQVLEGLHTLCVGSHP